MPMAQMARSAANKVGNRLGAQRESASAGRKSAPGKPGGDLTLFYFRFAMFSSPSFATISGPDDAGLTALSMWRILPSGAM